MTKTKKKEAARSTPSMRAAWRRASQAYRKRRIEAGLCLFPGCPEDARRGRRYCEKHRGKGGIRP